MWTEAINLPWPGRPGIVSRFWHWLYMALPHYSGVGTCGNKKTWGVHHRWAVRCDWSHGTACFLRGIGLAEPNLGVYLARHSQKFDDIPRFLDGPMLYSIYPEWIDVCEYQKSSFWLQLTQNQEHKLRIDLMQSCLHQYLVQSNIYDKYWTNINSIWGFPEIGGTPSHHPFSWYFWLETIHFVYHSLWKPPNVSLIDSKLPFIDDKPPFYWDFPS